MRSISRSAVRRCARLAAALVALWSAAAAAQAPAPAIDWPVEFYDPAAETRPADLILPLPCGGAIAFMRVDTPALAAQRLDDARIRLGSERARAERAPFDYVSRGFIRGAFADPEEGTTFYYIGRYEVTADQKAAVEAARQGEGACPADAPSLDGLEPATRVSWFDAVAFTKDLTEWLREAAPGALPAIDGAPGYVRLPSEVEWEYAARGGIVAEADGSFNAQRFFPRDDELRDYGWHDGLDSSQNEVKLIGELRPNPIGLYDVYGNVSEITLDLFRLNKFGRSHGQIGGFVARGGDYRTRAESISSSFRTEYSFFSRGAPRALSLRSVGFRLVLTHVVMHSDGVVADIMDEWREGAEPLDADDPLNLIDALLAEETETTRLEELQTLRSMVVSDRRARDDAAALALRRSIYAGATFAQSLRGAHGRFEALQAREARRAAAIADLEQRIAEAEAADDEDLAAVLGGSLEGERTKLEQLVARMAAIAEDIEILENNAIATLVSVYDFSTSDRLRAEANRLIIELGRSNQSAFSPEVSRFVNSVETYREDPDISRDEILALF
ncbi:MAG: SUMF1/EgtB/PvdO family nonheme iron enzyme [Pseudomonadota bacterium]